MTAPLHLPNSLTPTERGLAYNEAQSTKTTRDSWLDCKHLPPRKYAPPPDLLEPDAAHQPHPGYVGVYLESVKPRRYYYEVELDDRAVRGYGYHSPAKAARAYDECVQAFALDRPLNFSAQEEAS